jgi:putative acetyltransferase
MAVDPEHQHEGIGRALIQAFLADARARGFQFCVVLGDPAYYERFGFVTSLEHSIRSTYDVPPEVFMARRLTRSRLGLEGCVAHYEPEFARV